MTLPVVRIEVPKITPREAFALERQLPRGDGFDHSHVPKKDDNAFAKLYRYLTSFPPFEV